MIANPIPYKIVSDRLIIRCYEPADVYQLNEKTNRSKNHLGNWLSWSRDAPFTIEQHIDTIRRMRSMFDSDQDYTMGIFDKENGELYGGSGLHKVSSREYHIGYWIDVEHQKKGIITETVKALTQVGLFVNQLDFVQVCNAKENISSRAIPEKLGFKLEATLRKRLKIDENTYHDKEIWAMNKEEFIANPKMKLSIECFDMIGRSIYTSNF